MRELTMNKISTNTDKQTSNSKLFLPLYLSRIVHRQGDDGEDGEGCPHTLM